MIINEPPKVEINLEDQDKLKMIKSQQRRSVRRQGFLPILTDEDGNYKTKH